MSSHINFSTSTNDWKFTEDEQLQRMGWFLSKQKKSMPISPLNHHKTLFINWIPEIWRAYSIPITHSPDKNPRYLSPLATNNHPNRLMSRNPQAQSPNPAYPSFHFGSVTWFPDKDWRVPCLGRACISECNIRRARSALGYGISWPLSIPNLYFRFEVYAI